MSLGFVISSFRSVPNALLQRDMSFKSLALIDGAQALALAGVMVLLAVLGFGYWTLVIGNLLSATLMTVLTLTQCRRGFAWPRWKGLRPAITFGRQVLFVRLAWYAYSNADFFVAGRRLGREPLGAYSLAWTLASVPIEKIGVLIFNTAPAYFSSLQHDRAALRRNLLHLTEGISLLTAPLCIGLALVASEFVPLALGTKWIPMIVPLQLLAAYGAIRSIFPLINQILQVTGDTRYSMWNSIAAAIVLPIGFFVGSYWGIDGIAATWLVLHPIVLVLPYRRALRRIDLPFRSYLAAVLPAGNAALHMSAAVLGVRALLPAAVPLALRFAILVAVGASVYVGALFLYHRDRIDGLLRTVRQIKRGET
jgi:PST family polysaccharide transporter